MQITASPTLLSSRRHAARTKVIVVMPAYNAAATLEATYHAIDPRCFDEIILVDDCSEDETVVVAEKLALRIIRHAKNLGYGGNQKTCYREALQRGADIVVMLHPDGQYDPTLLSNLIQPLVEGRADIVLGSRFLIPGGARRGGMPLYRFLANRFLTFWENRVLRQRLSEYHTGYRAYSRAFLETVPFRQNSDGFCFDTEILVQAVAFRQRLVEIPITTKYFPGASSASLGQCVIYGLMTLFTLLKFLLRHWRLYSAPLFVGPHEHNAESQPPKRLSFRRNLFSFRAMR